ncbi:MAG: hypothetical protein ACOC2N_00050 [Spirochaetota bacterium]
MSLRDVTEQDNAFLVEDSEGGFAGPIELDDNAGNVYSLTGDYDRIGVEIDPDTGQMVMGSRLHVTVRLSRLDGAVPADGWKCTLTDVTGTQVVGYVNGVMADRSVGVVSFFVRAT